MPQEMNILCCYSCKMYQVHIVKKARKWQCKLCNKKQSIKQIHFQGSGKDCRLYVQRLNSLKANATSFSAVASEQDDNNIYYNSSPNNSQMSDYSKIVENKWAKYLDSPKKEQPSDTKDSSSENICEAEDIMLGEEFLCNDRNNDFCNFDDIMDDSDFEIEDVAKDHETKDPYSLSCGTNSDVDQRDNLRDNKSSKNHDNVTSIFETYDDLGNPLDF
ncbi:PREDICTED: UPF0544 protein C5orf45 homolog [Dinoponera quadriceps]|uniref:UPF0544 protein C5orf45 homolog n=1 Tax=Dinoponera quadriceps TaxID=609295 RepID=A0A6P3XFI5_DINQU|nr:PREDICTED: UPF0544 protein C5orf45 homolog [Dinoponera quadriceps]